MNGTAGQPDVNFAVSELGRTVLTLRRDLIFRPHNFAGLSCYIIEDPLKGKFYRSGLAEYALLSLFDGRTSVADALCLLATSMPHIALSEHDAASICSWLVSSELAFTVASSGADRIVQASFAARQAKVRRRCNPITLQLPLFKPDRFFEAIGPAVFWLFSWPGFLIWAALLIAAAIQAATHWRVLAAATSDVFIPNNWCWLALCWASLKAVHELAHGIVCKKYGGQIRGAGVVVILLAPIPYVDVTTSWRFRSKWQRIHTAAAGVFIELLFGAAALLVWSYTESVLLRQICLNLALLATATTVLFNANPLVKFDGYYILSDWVEMPNLYSTGQAYLKYLISRYCLGVRVSPPFIPCEYRTPVALYSVTTFAWRTGLCISLVGAVGHLYHGAGIILAATAIAVWFVIPLARWLWCLLHSKSWQRSTWIKAAAPRLLMLSLLLAVSFLIPWPTSDSAPGVVEFSPLSIVRAGSSGFVKTVYVENGQWVDEGQLLATMVNEQLTFELADLKFALDQAELRGRIHERRHLLAESQSDGEIACSLRKHVQEKQRQMDRLTVRSPRKGIVVGRSLNSLVGTYLKAGDELLAVGAEHKALRVSVAQEQLQAFENRVGEMIPVRISGSAVMLGRLSELEPRASVRTLHRSLCADVGGPLAVKRCDVDLRGAVATEDQFEFLSPRFSGTVELHDNDAHSLYSGQLANVLVPSGNSIAGHFFSALRDWTIGQD